MGHAATTGVIFDWNPDQNFVIHISHHVWFDECNYCLSIEDKNTPGYLLLQQYPEINFHKSDLLNLILCELDLKPNPFFDTTILTY